MTALRAPLAELAGVTLDELRERVECIDDFCCLGAFYRERCTCWQAEHDLVQAELQEGPPAVRATMCADCAFRPDSPERAGDERYSNSSAGALDTIGYGDTFFYCHQGMRRRIARVHPTGARALADRDDYDPPQRGACAYKASGAPADICAGFAAAARLRRRT